MSEIQKQGLTSMNIAEEQLRKLKELFPEAFTEGLNVDWDKLRLTLGQSIDVGKERYGMNWPGKADCFKTIQQPSIATLMPARNESVDFDTTENLFIEGDNLEVLKLLQKSYLGKIKFMYFDPPYNTGNEFIYPDNYSESLETYLEYTGQIDSSGKKFGTNTDTDGRFHSKWLNMMYPRLFLAKNLLADDGLIFISIDVNEVCNLRAICNEIFGEENFRNQIIIRRGAKSVQAQFSTWDKLGLGFEYVLMYSKKSDYRFPKMLRKLEESKTGSWNNHWRGTDRPTMRYEIFGIKPEEGQWRWGKDRSLTAIENYKKMLCDLGRNENNITQEEIDNWYIAQNDEDLDLLRLSNTGKPEHYIAPSDTMLLNDIWFDMPPHSSSTLKSLFGKKLFDNPKPLDLIKRVLEFGSPDTFVLDIFSGSGTTAQSVLELNREDFGNRKFICVQIPEPTTEKSEAFKSGYKTIADISKERIRRVALNIKNELEAERVKKSNQLKFENSEEDNIILDLGFKVFKLSKSNFKIWNSTLEKEPEVIQAKLFEHIQHISPEAEQEAILYELLLKSGFVLTTPIEKLTLAGLTVFSIAEGQLLICLEKELTHDCIKAMAEMQPTRVICLDEGFKGENADALKTNAVQIMKSKGVVNFRTV